MLKALADLLARFKAVCPDTVGEIDISDFMRILKVEAVIQKAKETANLTPEC
jgi:hypothetical protein